jgi:hypothetical protein
MPIASNPRVLLASAGAMALLIVVSLIGAITSRLDRRRSRHLTNPASASHIVGFIAALALGGLIAAASLTLVLPGSPAFDSVMLRWFLTAVAGLLVMFFAVFVIQLVRLWKGASSLIRTLGVLGIFAGGLLNWSLATFWVPVAWRSSNAGIEEIARKLRDAGVSVQSTLVVYESLGGQARAEMIADPSIDYLQPRTRKLWRGLSTDGPPGYSLPVFTRKLIGALHRAGVPIMAGTDAMGMELIIPGFSLHRELKLLRAAGLTPYEAIYAATRAPADFLRQSSEFGTIAAGQRADFLLLSQNPLEDISRIAQPLGVMARGRWFPQERLRELLDALRG